MLDSNQMTSVDTNNTLQPNLDVDPVVDHPPPDDRRSKNDSVGGFTRMDPTGRFLRVVVIGETGSGKSTTINALAGKQVVETSDSARGCTDHHTTVTIQDSHGISYEFVDTIGLNEVTTGTVDPQRALANFLAFLRDNQQGFNLILFCVRRDRLTQQAQATYNVMVKKLYSQAATEPPPVLIFVSGIFVKQATPQDWCIENRQAFVQAGLEEADATVDGLHCLSLPSNSPNVVLERAEIREKSTQRAWTQVRTRASPEPRPLYSNASEMIHLGIFLWNLFVDLCSSIPSPVHGNLKNAFGLVKKLPQQIRHLVEAMGINAEEAMALW